jgi:type II secretory pathway pseudopilin PulG
MLRKKQKGASLLEIILVLALISIVATGIILLIGKQIRNIKNQLTSTQMTTVLEASKSYVADNFGPIKSQLDAATCTKDKSIDDSGCVPPSEVGNITAGNAKVVSTIDIDPGILDGKHYLKSNALDVNGDIKTAWDSTLKIYASFVGDKDIVLISVINTDSENIRATDQMDISAGIKNGRGAAWYGEEGPIKSCTPLDSACVKSRYHQWELEYPNLVFTGAGLNPKKITAMAVGFIDAENASDSYLYRDSIKGHPELNEVNSDLNFVTAQDSSDDLEKRTIFFNSFGGNDNDVAGEDGHGVKDFSGAGLTYTQRYDAGSATERAVVSVNNNVVGGDDPYFTSQDGMITGRVETSGNSCILAPNDISSDFGLLATDSSGNMLKCVLDVGLGGSFWKEIGDTDYVHWIVADPTTGVIGVIMGTGNLTTNLTGGGVETVYDLEGEHPGLGLGTASAIIIEPTSWTPRVPFNSTANIYFKTLEPISKEPRVLFESNIAVQNTSRSDLNPWVLHSRQELDIVAIKDGKLIYQYDYTVATEPSPTLSSPTQMTIMGYIE